MNRSPLALLIAAACATPLAAQAAFNTLDGSAPLIIGHRGASGYLPEHTIEAYTLAIQQGANFIEPDVVMTKDGKFIARHEPMLGGTTDVATRAEFAGRKTTRMVDGVAETNWFASDFTLAEIRTLRAIQPRASRPQRFNGLYQIPTLDEVITLAQAQSTALGRPIGIYPEIKHSTFHAGRFGDKVFENALVDTLHAAYGNNANAPVFVQSFEIGNLQYLNTRTDIRLVQLVDANDVKPDGTLDLTAPYGQPYDVAAVGGTLTFQDMLTPVGLGFIKTYADGVGPWKPYLVKTVDGSPNGDLPINDRLVIGSTGVVEAAHAAGLLVHAYTFRDDASGYGFADPKAEMVYYFNVGVDGVFTDFPDTGMAALAAVPEPQTYALMLLGLVAVGAAARRRRV